MPWLAPVTIATELVITVSFHKQFVEPELKNIGVATSDLLVSLTILFHVYSAHTLKCSSSNTAIILRSIQIRLSL